MNRQQRQPGVFAMTMVECEGTRFVTAAMLLRPNSRLPIWELL